MITRAQTVGRWFALSLIVFVFAGVSSAQSPRKVPSVAPSSKSDDGGEKKIFLIGNSLTWDCLPTALGGEVAWHVDCGKNLQQIFDAPQKPCVPSSKNWNKALVNQQFDYLCVQPHYGTNLSQDVQLIDGWMKLQPRAAVVIHTGWAGHADQAWEFTTQLKSPSDNAAMVHSPAYFRLLVEALEAKHPDRRIRTTGMLEALELISQDVQAQRGPLKSLSELYRDSIHLSLQNGRYLAHNMLRRALEMPLSSRGFQLEPELQNYLDATISAASARAVQR